MKYGLHVAIVEFSFDQFQLILFPGCILNQSKSAYPPKAFVA